MCQSSNLKVEKCVAVNALHSDSSSVYVVIITRKTRKYASPLVTLSLAVTMAKLAVSGRSRRITTTAKDQFLVLMSKRNISGNPITVQ